ncbi:MAG: DNA polymerase III subunit delta, partial [Rhodospirillaceae bacterium]|nr:DNA polymerase III subunit delta [Rhodospirillaceae bacterium]
MKIATTKIGSFINTLPENIKTVLLFGPDQGLVRERAEVLVHGMVGNLSDPFRVAEISANNLRDDPALLFDEA